MPEPPSYPPTTTTTKVAPVVTQMSLPFYFSLSPPSLLHREESIVGRLEIGGEMEEYEGGWGARIWSMSREIQFCSQQRPQHSSGNNNIEGRRRPCTHTSLEGKNNKGGISACVSYPISRIVRSFVYCTTYAGRGEREGISAQNKGALSNFPPPNENDEMLLPSAKVSLSLSLSRINPRAMTTLSQSSSAYCPNLTGVPPPTLLFPLSSSRHKSNQKPPCSAEHVHCM